MRGASPPRPAPASPSASSRFGRAGDELPRPVTLFAGMIAVVLPGLPLGPGAPLEYVP